MAIPVPWLVAILGAAASVLAQASLGASLALGGVSPDLVLVVVTLVALAAGPEAGCLFGFVAGFLLDGIGAGPLGVHALAKATAGFAVGLAGARLAAGHPGAAALAALGASAADALLRYGLLATLGWPADLLELLRFVVLPQAGAAALLAAGGALVLASLGRRQGRRPAGSMRP